MNETALLASGREKGGISLKCQAQLGMKSKIIRFPDRKCNEISEQNLLKTRRFPKSIMDIYGRDQGSHQSTCFDGKRRRSGGRRQPCRCRWQRKAGLPFRSGRFPQRGKSRRAGSVRRSQLCCLRSRQKGGRTKNARESVSPQHFSYHRKASGFRDASRKRDDPELAPTKRSMAQFWPQRLSCFY